MNWTFNVRSSRMQVRTLTHTWWLIASAGMFLILVGIAIVIWPQLLAIMVAAGFIGAGLVILGWAWQVRRLRDRYRDYRDDIWHPY